MSELLWSFENLNAFTIWMTAAMVGGIVWFIKEVIGSATYAIIFAPFLVFGALVSNYFFVGGSIVLSGDRDTQTVSALAIGMFVTLLLLLGVSSVFVAVSNHFARKSRKGRREKQLAKMPLILSSAETSPLRGTDAPV